MRHLVVLLVAAAALAGPEEDIRAMLEGKTAIALMKSLDAEALTARMHRLGVPRSFKKETVRLVLPLMLADWGEQDQRITVRKVAVDRNEATAVVDHWEVGYGAVRARWFLVRRGGRWVPYDMEDVESGMRFVSIIAAGLRAVVGDAATMGPLMAIGEAVEHLDAEDFESARAALDKVDDSKLPRELQGVRLYMLCVAHTGVGDSERALEPAARIEELGLDMPGIFLVRAMAQNELRRHEQAVASARRFIELVGGHATAYGELGLAFWSLGRTKEAGAAYFAGLAEDPNDAACFAGWAVTLPEKRKSEIAVRFRRLARPIESMDEIAWAVLDADDYAALAVLVDAMGKLAPEHIDYAFYRAAVEIHEGKHRVAADRLAQALPRVTGQDNRAAFVEWYVDAMIGAGAAHEAFERLGPRDRGPVFETICAELADAGHTDDLELVVERFGRDGAGPARIVPWQVEIAWLRKRHREVCRLMDEAALEPGEGWEYQAHERWLASLLALERGADALVVAGKLDWQYHELWVHAATGDVEQAIAAFGACVDDGWTPAHLYEAEDLAPYLASEKMRRLREKFPRD